MEDNLRTLTHAEMVIMKKLWDKAAPMSTHELVATYPDPKPSYSTEATFLRILYDKGFITHTRLNTAKTHYFFPLVSREEYVTRVLTILKNDVYDGSLADILRYFLESNVLTDIEKEEIALVARKFLGEK